VTLTGDWQMFTSPVGWPGGEEGRGGRKEEGGGVTLTNDLHLLSSPVGWPEEA